MLVDSVVSVADTEANGPCVPEHGWNVVVTADGSRGGGGTRSTYTNSQSETTTGVLRNYQSSSHLFINSSSDYYYSIGILCSFSNPVSHRSVLTSDDAGRLTRCHQAPVSNSCHFFRSPLPIGR